MESELFGYQRGAFSDVIDRLGVITLEVPPLRQHSADIAPLVERMLTLASLRYHRSELRLSEEAVDALASYQWLGNILELRNAIERAVVLCREEAITPAYLVLHRNRLDSLPSTPIR